MDGMSKRMSTEGVDLNLLVALDALLAEGSVTGAARRLGLSNSAMSRTLARLRVATGDPLLVRAGRGLVPTPRAAELRDHVHALTQDAQAVLLPKNTHLDLASLDQVFTLRVSEAFMAFLAGPLVNAIAQSAPRVCLRFAAKPDKDARPLREGPIDLEVGVLGTAAPEIRVRLLFHDRYVGVARLGHPLLTYASVTAERYAACGHVTTSRGNDMIESLDAGLASLGFQRALRVVVPGYPDAMRIARQTDLLAVVPHSCLGNRLASHQADVSGLATFELPVPLAPFNVSAMWHPRVDAAPAHRWLRDTVIAVCREAYPLQ